MNNKKTTGNVCVSAPVSLDRFCALPPRARSCLFVWVLFSLSRPGERLLSVTHCVAGPQTKSLVPMNTVRVLLYRLTDGCVVPVSQCCAAEPGRRSYGNRYRCHGGLRLSHALITPVLCLLSLYRVSFTVQFKHTFNSKT